MEGFSKNLYDEMQTALHDIGIENDSNIKKAKQAIEIVNDHLKKLNEFIKTYQFRDIADEINYFKNVRPMFLKEMFYYNKLLDIKKRMPPVAIKKYYQKQISLIKAYFKEKHFLYSCYISDDKSRDEALFIREPQFDSFFSEYGLDIDSKVSNIYSIRIGEIQAFLLLKEYLLIAIDTINNPGAPNPKNARIKPDTTWTDSNADLIELAYAIHSKGSVNHGKADVKLIVMALEYVFNISLGNYSAVFNQNIRIRKKNRTPYVDGLKEYLIRRMDDLDENPRFK